MTGKLTGLCFSLRHGFVGFVMQLYDEIKNIVAYLQTNRVKITHQGSYF
jgi:hypothetical protein